jgi:hypothetical protein
MHFAPMPVRGVYSVAVLLPLFAGTVSASAQDLICRLDRQPWLACAAVSPNSGSACSCPTASQGDHDATGHVGPATPDELVYHVATTGTKASFGLDWLAGPVIALIPHRVAEAHFTPTSAAEEQQRELYDYLHEFQNLQAPAPWPQPVLSAPWPPPSPK